MLLFGVVFNMSSFEENELVLECPKCGSTEFIRIVRASYLNYLNISKKQAVDKYDFDIDHRDHWQCDKCGFIIEDADISTELTDLFNAWV
jgi:ribosomal protein S27AE